MNAKCGTDMNQDNRQSDDNLSDTGPVTDESAESRLWLGPEVVQDLRSALVQNMGQEVRNVVAHLRSNKKWEREAAERQLKLFGSEAVQELLVILMEERQQRKRRQKTGVAAYLCFIAVMITIAILARAPMLLNMIGSMTSLITVAFAASQTQRRVAVVLAQLEDLRTVGALVEALEYQDKSISVEIEQTLIRLLPQLKASDAHLLDDQQRICLYHALNRKNTTLVRVILQALEQVGDGKAVPYVQKVAEGHGRSGGNPDLRALAQQCLPFLLQRADEERSRQMLLRPSDASEQPVIASDTLLRPAAGVTPADPAQLLRAASEDEQTIQEPHQTTAPAFNFQTIRPTDEETASVLRVGRE
jgi:HEAT repeat protein